MLSIFVGFSERRYAKAESARLLELYWRERRAHPDLKKKALYESIVAQRLGVEAGRASQIVLRAEESFTDWPVERELIFRHVVHYLIFAEYMRAGGEARAGTKTNMGVVVARIIPEDI